MRLCGYEWTGERHIGRVLDDGSIMPVAPVNVFYADTAGFLAKAAVDSGERVSADATMRPAVPKSARVPCVGLNYKAHAAEGNLPIPDRPVIFGRFAASLAVDGDAIPRFDEQTDWEGELAVVVGRPLLRASPDEARGAILGYAVFNDVSARSFQFHSSQWSLGKNGDNSGIMGAIVTADETGDPADGWRLLTRVNGAVMQDTLTSDMIFPVPEILSYLSQAMTLNPGDIVPTGTPSGVGLARTSPQFLRAGDEVEVSIDALGTIRNRVN